LVMDVYRRRAPFLRSRLRRRQGALAAEIDRAQLRQKFGGRGAGTEERICQYLLVLARAGEQRHLDLRGRARLAPGFAPRGAALLLGGRVRDAVEQSVEQFLAIA